MSWKTINEMYRLKHPNILQVIDLILSLPAGTSECERGFSQMKIVKNHLRNKLRPTTMTLLLTVQLHSADIKDYNPTTAIHSWNNSKRRRPTFMERSSAATIDAMLDEAEATADVPAQAAARVKADSDYESDFSDLDYFSASESESFEL